jgi:ClpP class serine protease
MKYPHLAAQIFNVPLLARPETAEVFAQAFVQILVGEAHVGALPRPAASAREAPPESEAFASSARGRRFADKPYVMTDSGIGVLPVYGALAQRAGEITPDCTEMTSYQRLTRTFDAMVADPDVRGILLEVDSPGGQVAGNFELGRRIVAARARSPSTPTPTRSRSRAATRSRPAAEKLYVPDTGLVGSIGVIMLHMSQAERDARAGYKYTAIFAGAKKNDHNPHFELSEDARAASRRSSIRTTRPSSRTLPRRAASIRRPCGPRKPACWSPGKRSTRELVDGISTFQETLAALESRVKGAVVVPGAGMAAHQPKEKAMSEQGKPAATEHQQPAENQPAQVDAGKVAADARKAERERVNGILNCEEAKGRPTLAQHLASETEMGVDEAKKLLAKSPVEGAAAGRTEFARTMDALGNPKIGAGAAEGAETVDALARQVASHVTKLS